jgi:hypothetical protein
MLLAASVNILVVETAGAVVAVTAALTALSRPIRKLTQGHRDEVLAAVAAARTESAVATANLDAKNTKQHEEGRIERANSEEKTLTAIAVVDSKVDEVSLRAARLEGAQQVWLERAQQLPSWSQ